MATVNSTKDAIEGHGQDEVLCIRWTPLTTTNVDGSWEMVPAYADRTVHVFGTFGAGCTLSIEGTNEVGTPAKPVTVNDSRGEGNPMTFLTAGGDDIKVMAEAPLKVRPKITGGGDGTTSLTVIMVCRRAR